MFAVDFLFRIGFAICHRQSCRNCMLSKEANCEDAIAYYLDERPDEFLPYLRVNFDRTLKNPIELEEKKIAATVMCFFSWAE